MHSVFTADLAALISHHGPSMVACHEAVAVDALTDYWTASKSRFELWHQAMARYRHCEQRGDAEGMRQWWRDHAVVLEEILVTEMLTRVVAALAVGLEADQLDKEMTSITHAVQRSHLEARNRVQKIMLFGRGNSVHDAVRLNRLRQGVERWTDAMIGRMSINTDLTIQYAIDASRASEYAVEMRAYGYGAARNTAAWLMNAAMHDLLRRRTSSITALPEANRSVAQSVMRMLRPSLFDNLGVLKSLWLHRMEMGTEKTDQLLSESGISQGPSDEAKSDVDPTPSPFERWYI